MNLLEMLKTEIENLGIRDKVQIKDYLYTRTGQIFNYDPRYLFSNEEDRKLFQNALS